MSLCPKIITTDKPRLSPCLLATATTTLITLLAVSTLILVISTLQFKAKALPHYLHRITILPQGYHLFFIPISSVMMLASSITIISIGIIQTTSKQQRPKWWESSYTWAKELLDQVKIPDQQGTSTTTTLLEMENIDPSHLKRYLSSLTSYEITLPSFKCIGTTESIDRLSPCIILEGDAIVYNGLDNLYESHTDRKPLLEPHLNIQNNTYFATSYSYNNVADLLNVFSKWLYHRIPKKALPVLPHGLSSDPKCFTSLLEKKFGLFLINKADAVMFQVLRFKIAGVYICLMMGCHTDNGERHCLATFNFKKSSTSSTLSL